MQRKKAPLGKPGSIVAKSVISGGGFKPGDSQNSFSTTRSKPLVKGGGGALKEKDDMEDMEFGDLQNEEYEFLMAKMDMEQAIHTIKLKNEKSEAKEEGEKKDGEFFMKFMREAETKIKQNEKDKELFSRPKMLKTRPQ